jgi:hypothetical protein
MGRKNPPERSRGGAKKNSNKRGGTSSGSRREQYFLEDLRPESAIDSPIKDEGSADGESEEEGW